MTPDELVDRVRNSVDGVEIEADRRETDLALLRAGMTISGIALSRMDEDEREYQLEKLEANTREYLSNLADAARRRRFKVN